MSSRGGLQLPQLLLRPPEASQGLFDRRSRSRNLRLQRRRLEFQPIGCLLRLASPSQVARDLGPFERHGLDQRRVRLALPARQFSAREGLIGTFAGASGMGPRRFILFDFGEQRAHTLRNASSRTRVSIG